MNAKTYSTSSNSSKTIVYFDFDGTITTFDTFILFLIYSVGLSRFLIRSIPLIPSLILYFSKKINNEALKQKAVHYILKGYDLAFLTTKAEAFSKSKLLKRMLKESVIKKLQYHIDEGHHIVLVSANLGIYLRYLGKDYGIHEVIATELEFVDNKITGKLKTRNCYGEQKVIRINEYLQANNLSFNHSIAYGNSRGDYEMLKLVDEPYWVTKSKIQCYKVEPL